jgi:hypothetical protein
MTGHRKDGRFVPDHQALVFKYPLSPEENVEVHESLQGEDPIRLLGIALQSLHEHLSMIEIALQQGRFEGFRDDELRKAYSYSTFFSEEPSYYR